MNYRERLRKAIECPQFGNINYGEYGALRLDQRKNIKRLLDEMDRADKVIKNQFFEIERLHSIIKEAREYIEKHELNGNKISEMLCGSEIVELKEILDKVEENK